MTPETMIGIVAVVEHTNEKSAFLAHDWAEMMAEPRLPRPFAGFPYERPTTNKPTTLGMTENEEPISFYLAHFLSFVAH